MVARPDLPVRSVDDLIALAKANPAKPLTYGSVGPGSMYHLVTEDGGDPDPYRREPHSVRRAWRR